MFRYAKQDRMCPYKLLEQSMIKTYLKRLCPPQTDNGTGLFMRLPTTRRLLFKLVPFAIL